MDDKSIERKGDIWQSELLTSQEVATYLRVSRVTVWRWCKRGVIPAFQVGRNWRIRRVNLLNLEEHPGGGDGRIDGDDPIPTSSPSEKERWL